MRFRPSGLTLKAVAQRLNILKQRFWSGMIPNATGSESVQPIVTAQPLLSEVLVGITTGTLGILFDLSFAALIFSNSLSGYLSAGIGFILFSAAATRIMVGLVSSFPGMVADLAGIPTAILAWSTGMVVRHGCVRVR